METIKPALKDNIFPKWHGKRRKGREETDFKA